ncbi:cysteine peptidase family C39 domain-containing protein [Chryseobacterium gregarium]|uniref:cysteine peptidase family C39 domain-containing protein n=1 Tax=Chryseobacterium gregarium TaxID=456299 RepID=UPI00042426C5|nr:cysteine peptidase family C39 domain-containing protein [Chryseobacterium gregarium]
MLPADYNKIKTHEIFKIFFQHYEPKKIIQEVDCENLDFTTLHTILSSTFKIENVIGKISIDDLVNIPLPAIAFLNINGGSFAVISEITESHVKWTSPQYGEQKNSMNLFKKIYSGLVLTCITV